MKYGVVAVVALLIACSSKEVASPSPLTGTWKLIKAETLEQGDTTVTFPSEGIDMIKMFNESHFAFFNHDLMKGQDTSKVIFVAGAGTYTLNGQDYHERLDYCNARGWEGHEFDFTIELRQDTLIQRGIEEIDSLGVNREIIEWYVRATTE